MPKKLEEISFPMLAITIVIAISQAFTEHFFPSPFKRLHKHSFMVVKRIANITDISLLWFVYPYSFMICVLGMLVLCILVDGLKFSFTWYCIDHSDRCLRTGSPPPYQLNNVLSILSTSHIWPISSLHCEYIELVFASYPLYHVYTPDTVVDTAILVLVHFSCLHC